MARATQQRPEKKITKKKSSKKKVLKKKGVKKSKKKTDDPFPRPLGIACYGPGGVGKTSLFAHFPNPKFIIGKDTGILDLVDYQQCPQPHSVEPVATWEELLEECDNTLDQDCDTVVFDNLTDFEEMCFMSHCESYFSGDWSDRGFYSFNKGPKNAAKVDWPDLLQRCTDLIASGKHVVLIGHSQVKSVPNPDGADWIQYLPDLDSAIWSRTHYWSKCTLFYSLYTETKKDGTRTKASDDDFSHIIFTQPSPAYIAKNRFGLPPTIDAGTDGAEAYENFVAAFDN